MSIRAYLNNPRVATQLQILLICVCSIYHDYFKTTNTLLNNSPSCCSHCFNCNAAKTICTVIPHLSQLIGSKPPAIGENPQSRILISHLAHIHGHWQKNVSTYIIYIKLKPYNLHNNCSSNCFIIHKYLQIWWLHILHFHCWLDPFGLFCISTVEIAINMLVNCGLQICDFKTALQTTVGSRAFSPVSRSHLGWAIIGSIELQTVVP